MPALPGLWRVSSGHHSPRCRRRDRARLQGQGVVTGETGRLLSGLRQGSLGGPQSLTCPAGHDSRLQFIQSFTGHSLTSSRTCSLS